MEALESSENAGKLVGPLREISASYDARSPDRDFGERVGASRRERRVPLILYVGKLIHSKGVHSLLSVFVRARRQTNARLLVIGFGTFREGLQALTLSMSAGDRRLVESIAETGRLLEGGPAGPLEHFGLSEALLRDAAGMEDGVEFVGPLGHANSRGSLPAADVGVVPPSSPRPSGSWRPSSRRAASSRSLPTTRASGGQVRSSAVACPLRCASAWTASREPGTHPDRVPGAPGRGTAAVRRSGAAQLHRASRLGDARAEDRGARER